jgi:hypothetical protein
MVEAKCEWCGIVFSARKDRIEKGQSRWCSRPHYLEWLAAQGSQRKNIGKENAIIQWEETKNMFCAYWYDENMKYHSAGWARWYWELNIGEVPKGRLASYKDGDSKNATPGNICLKTMSEISNIGDRSRGVPKSEASKKKMSIAHTDKVLSEEHRKHIADANRKKWADGVFDMVHVGENNARWRGGVKYRNYPKEFFTIRRWIIERDNETCQICGKDASRKGHIHHIDGNTKHNTEDNLILVCASCHIKIHSNFPAISSILAFRSKLEWNKL